MKTEKSIAPAVEIQTFPLDHLYLSAINPRQDVTAAEIEGMAASIRACGLIQNLAGLVDDKGKVAIVAGGRRLRALQHMAEAGDKIAPVPVRLAQSEDTAQRWAVAENEARAPLEPADEIRAYGQMSKSGFAVDAIASAFAVTEAHVHRRMKLAALPVRVLDALKARTINLTSAEAFTLAQSVEQTTEALDAVTSGRITDQRQLRRFFSDNGVTPDDRRVKFVGLDAYEAEGGAITRDLFSDDVICHDEALIDRLFAEKLDATAELIEAGGWKWAEAIEDSYIPYHFMEERKFGRLYKIEGELTEDEAEEYDELAELYNGDVLSEDGAARLEALQEKMDGAYSAEQMAIAGVVICVGRDGSLDYSHGLVREEDKEAAYDADLLTRPAKPHTPKDEGPKSPYSMALADDLRAIELGAVQTALLSKPELVLDILAFALSKDSGPYNSILGVSLTGERNAPSKGEAFSLDARLAGAEGTADGGPKDYVAAFDKFRKKGRKHRNVELTSSFARVINHGCGRSTAKTKPSLFDAIASEIGADVRAIWTPTAEAFFDRVKADYLNDLYRELFAVEETDTGYKGFVGQKKAAKAGTMEKLFKEPAKATDMHNNPADAETIARIKAWRPTGY